MNTVRSRLFLFIILALCVLGLGVLQAQEPNSADLGGSTRITKSIETGLLPLRNFSSLEYDARPQNWALVRDHRGVMYFGNNEGILEFDGIRWRKIPSPDETTIRSLAIDDNGRIYVGAQGDFGFLSPDSSGKLQYRSLLHKLQSRDREFADVWRTLVTGDGVYYQSSDIIFLYHNDTIKTWHAEKDVETNKSYHLMFYANETVYVRQRGIGLKKMIGDQLVLVQGGEVFPEDKIYFMTDFYGKDVDKEPRILLNTRSQGLFTMSPTPKDYYPADRRNPEHTNKIVSFKTDIDEFLIENLIYNGIQLGDSTFSVGTLGDGLVVLDKGGKLQQVLNKSTGLQDGTIYSQYMDDQGMMWLALANGISKVEINSPMTIFNDESGLAGVIQDITRTDDIVYVATLLGVFYMPTLESKLRDDNVDHENLEAYEPRFNKIANLTTECWDLLTYEDGQKEILLIASNTGIYKIEGGNLSQIATNDTWKMYRSKLDPSRVYLGTAKGLASIYYSNGEWIDEGMIDGVEGEIRNIYEDNQENLWLSNGEDVLYKMKILAFKNDKIDEIELTALDSTSGMPLRNISMQSVKNKVLFASDGVYNYDAISGKFVASDILGDKFAGVDYGIHRMSIDPSGKVWMVAYRSSDNKIDIGYVDPERVEGDEQDPSWVKTPFKGISNEIKHAIFHDDDGVTWLGGPEGLFRYDSKVDKDYKQTYYSLIRKVTVGVDSVVFWGAHYDYDGNVNLKQHAVHVPTLPYDLNSIEFEFAASNFQTGSTVKFSYFLEGFDKSWSDWNDEAKKEYTNLPEKEYKFKVKAIDTYDHESVEAVYAFTIKPPWHRTLWAYIAYVLAFIAFVYAAITVSTRGLQKIIKEKTADIVAQKEVIEEKNKDITDSINYAQKIQEAILPSHEDITKHLPENFILFKPKDIVSGDFYWFSERDGKALIIAADCTGHGVPGAFMSMIGNSLLNEIVNEKGATQPAEILQKLKEGVIKSLSQTGEAGTQKDGMDIALCAFDMANLKLEFSGAYNPLFRIRNGELEETRSDRMPIGVYSDDGGKVFTNYPMDMEKGDMYYFFTDGFVDQFGGPKGKKFMGKRFKALLMELHQLPMNEQSRKLDEVIEDWKAHVMGDGNTYEQMDDILIIGVRV
ncbi:MAG TPA: hypothetical protein EYN38_08140 [Flavobacteriales bacterium]|nr:hypothetical protein [Flavobacteriales bacterium]